MSSGETSDPRPKGIGASPSRVDADLTSFEELEQIGAGGNADVVKAAYQGNGPDVCALKQPRMQGTLSSDAIGEFTAEAETWEKLDDHDHIVGVLDHGETPFPWIALEYMDGGSLDDRLATMEVGAALWTGVCIARAVRHAHRRGIAHLDLKPDNVLFTTREDGWDVPKVTDWGLAKMLLEHSQSVEGLSPHYAAPEQFDAGTYGHPDDYTDIYATGAVVYAALTGEPPFTGSAASVMQDVLSADPTPPSDRVDGLPDGTDEVVLKALEKDKDDRYESILDLRRELETLVEEALDPSSAGPGQATRTNAQTDSPTTSGQSTQNQQSSATTTVSNEHSTTPTQQRSQTTATSQGDTRPRERTAGQQSGANPATGRQAGRGFGFIETAIQRLLPGVFSNARFNSGVYLLGALLLFLAAILVAPASEGLAGLTLLAGLVGAIYYWNEDMKNVQNGPDIDWSPRRYLYFFGVFFYGISFFYYLYKRRKLIGLP